ncbi:MAG: hypothetical protein AAB403_12765 [Planctomycetota bacterium]
MAVDLNVPVESGALSVPAVLVNRFQALRTKDLVRLSFAETFPGHPEFYRFAVALTFEDAKQLGELLTQLVSKPISPAGT